VFDKWRMLTIILKMREGGKLDSSIVKSTIVSFVERSKKALEEMLE